MISMVLLGLLGFGHCLGMCGPLTLAFPARIGGFPPHIWYHLGRLLMYTAIGTILGALGGALGNLNAVANIQVVLGSVAAVFLMLFGLSRLGLIPEPRLLLTANPAAIPGFGAARAAAGRTRAMGMFPMGMVNGLLPCGLSYAAFTRALPAGGAVEGGLLLVAFGVGTLPGLLILGTAAAGFLRRHRAMSDILSGVLMIGMGLDLAADVVQALF
jgi:hypothetical protein